MKFPNETDGSPIEPGDIRVLRPIPGSSGRARLVYVTDVGDHIVNVLLCSEGGTDVLSVHDVIVSGVLPFNAIVETDIAGCCYPSQLGPRLANVPPPLDGYPHGIMPVLKGSALWSWKDHEMFDLQRLCIERFLDSARER